MKEREEILDQSVPLLTLLPRLLEIINIDPQAHLEYYRCGSHEVSIVWNEPSPPLPNDDVEFGSMK